MNLATWLARAARSYPDLCAVGYGTAAYQDYRSLANRAARLAATLRHDLGLKPGDRVALAMKNTPDYMEILWGLWWANISAVPVNAKLHGNEFKYILENSGSRVVFTTPDLTETIEQYKPDSVERVFEIRTAEHEALFGDTMLDLQDAHPEDMAWLFYTSGTTGRPKGAQISHRNIAAMTFGYLSDIEPVHPGEQCLHAAPLSHGSGMYMVPHLCKAGVNVIPESGGFDPAEIGELAKHWGAVSMFAAPTMVTRLTGHPGDIDPTGIRTITYGGAPMYVDDAIRAIDRFGNRFAQLFGQGESPMTGTILSKSHIADRDHPNWRHRLGSIGIANSTVECSIADDDGTLLGPNEIGEVVIRGDAVFKGYWNNPEATAKALKHGWLYTGDVGEIDAEGFITLKDRSKDMIISGGSNIYPREIEEVLLTDERVREVSVIGRPDSDWGEVVVAYVVGDGVGPADLDKLCLDNIARFKRPKEYVFVDALPKSNYGKILKTELRSLDKERQG